LSRDSDSKRILKIGECLIKLLAYKNIVPFLAAAAAADNINDNAS